MENRNHLSHTYRTFSKDMASRRRAISRDAESRREQETRRKSKPLTYAWNRLVSATSIAIIIGLLLSLINRAFAISGEAGLRSLAAAALPPLVITYITFFNRSPGSRSPKETNKVTDVNLYFVSAIWTIVLLIFTNFVNSYFNYSIPLGEIAISITLSVLVFFSRNLSAKSFLSCSYGIVSGFLVHILLFGLQTR
jgi:ABC-type multidrug transport system fused ATPase/permease subunit